MAHIYLISFLLLQVYQITAQDSTPSISDASFIAQFLACFIPCVIATQEFYPCPANNLACMCDSPFRAAAAPCETLNCSPADYLKNQQLNNLLCHDFYANGTLNPSSVSVAKPLPLSQRRRQPILATT